MFTPLLVVMIPIGTIDLIFELDSFPAIFGLITEPYLVFTANVFALRGLRQLYCLLGGLLQGRLFWPWSPGRCLTPKSLQGKGSPHRVDEVSRSVSRS